MNYPPKTQTGSCGCLSQCWVWGWRNQTEKRLTPRRPATKVKHIIHLSTYFWAVSAVLQPEGWSSSCSAKVPWLGLTISTEPAGQGQGRDTLSTPDWNSQQPQSHRSPNLPCRKSPYWEGRGTYSLFKTAFPMINLVKCPYVSNGFCSTMNSN